MSFAPFNNTDRLPCRFVSSNERKRRQTYRGEVHGQLPFDNKGMDEPTLSLEVSTTGQSDSLFSLSKEDIARQFHF